MSHDEELEALTRWATTSGAVDRGQLLLSLANVVAAEDLRRRPRAQALVEGLLPQLFAVADDGVRRELAERLAEAPWAPAALLEGLAAAPLEIARPLLARSRALPADLLARLASEGSAERLLVLARREQLDADLVDALLERADPDSLTVLLASPHLRLSLAQAERLTELSRRLPALRAPLSRRPELTQALAARMLAWSGESCRRTLAGRFGLQPTPEGPADVEADARYLGKLERAGRLTPGYALKLLREGRLAMFEQALAALGVTDAEAVREALDADTPDRLYEVCAAAGLDRAVHPVIAAHVRALNGGRPGRPSAEVA